MPEIKQLFSSPRCQHVHYSGRPCKAPARRGRNYCVFHQAAHLDPGGCTLPIVEDLHSYQIAVIRIMQSLAADAIDSKKATALLYALQLLGSKLDAFAQQRDEIEDAHRALNNEIRERYTRRRRPFPVSIPEKDLLAILREMRAEQPAEPNDAIERIPQTLPACHPEAERSDAEGPMHSGAAQSIDPSSALRPPQDDSATRTVRAMGPAPALQSPDHQITKSPDPVASPAVNAVPDDPIPPSPGGGVVDNLEACDEPAPRVPRPSPLEPQNYLASDAMLGAASRAERRPWWSWIHMSITRPLSSEFRSS